MPIQVLLNSLTKTNLKSKKQFMGETITERTVLKT